jgi:hypothetical protein
VATSGIRLAPRSGQTVIAPGQAAQVSGGVFRSGFDTLLIDLRHTRFPASGTTVPLRIEAGVRRTIVALPAGQCVRVVVHYSVDPTVARLGSLLTGHEPPFSGAVVFGRTVQAGSGPTAVVLPAPGAAGPVLSIDFHSQGGGLYVRDYPDSVDPDLDPDWPGYQVFPEPYPALAGEPPKVKTQMIRAWRERRAAQIRSQRLVDSLLPGPCVRGGAA